MFSGHAKNAINTMVNKLSATKIKCCATCCMRHIYAHNAHEADGSHQSLIGCCESADIVLSVKLSYKLTYTDHKQPHWHCINQTELNRIRAYWSKKTEVKVSI